MVGSRATLESAEGSRSGGEEAKSRVTERDANLLRTWRVIPSPDVCLSLDSTQVFSQIRRLSESKQNKKTDLDVACCLLALVEWQLIRPAYQAIKDRVCCLFSKISCQRPQRQTAETEALGAKVALLI